MTDILERLRGCNPPDRVITAKWTKVAKDIHEAAAEIERLRAALQDMIEITKRNSNADLMLIAIRKCAEHALGLSR